MTRDIEELIGQQRADNRPLEARYAQDKLSKLDADLLTTMLKTRLGFPLPSYRELSRYAMSAYQIKISPASVKTRLEKIIDTFRDRETATATEQKPDTQLDGFDTNKYSQAIKSTTSSVLDTGE